MKVVFDIFEKLPRWLKAIFLCVLCFIGGWLWGWLSRHAPPDPKEPVVIIDPTPEQKTKTVYVYAQQLDGHTQAHIDLPPEGPKPGEVYRAPAVGEVKTTVTDERTGEVLAKTTREVTGETVATFTADGLDLGTTFNFSQEIAVSCPKPPPRMWEIGAVAAASSSGDWFAGGYGRRKIGVLEIGRLAIAPWIGGAFGKSDDGVDGVIMVGIAGTF